MVSKKSSKAKSRPITRPRARPSHRKKVAYCEKTAKEILRFMEVNHESLRRALAQRPSYPTRRTFYRWRKDNPWLDSEYELVCEARDDDAFEEIEEIANATDEESYSRDKLRIDTRKWSLGKRQPVRYGTQKIDVDNKNVGPVKVEIVSYDDDTSSV